jgi:hypothetical protein
MTTTVFKPSDHHATLSPCRECARLELAARMARTEKEREQWRRLLTAHLHRQAGQMEMREERAR